MPTSAHVIMLTITIPERANCNDMPAIAEMISVQSVCGKCYCGLHTVYVDMGGKTRSFDIDMNNIVRCP